MRHYVIITIPVLLVGGTEMQTLNLVRTLVANGYQVTVCCYYDQESSMVIAMEAAGAHLVLLDMAWSVGLWQLLAKLRRFFAEQHPDIVHVQYIAPGLVPVIAAKLAGIKTIFATVHQPGSPYGLKAKLFLRTAARLCTAFFCNSLAVEKSWFGRAELYQPGCAKLRRHYTIYNAVDTVAIAKAVEDADRNALRLQLGLRDGPVVGIVGRLRWEKGQALLLDAFSIVLEQFPDAQLLIVGDGPDRLSLEQRAKNLGIVSSIFWLGQKSPEEVYRLYSIMDIVAVPSVFEGFGLVAAEAMAAGLPVVASSVGGLAEVIEDDKTGYLVPPGVSAALADALTNLFANREKAKAMGRMGQERVRRQFSIEKSSQTILSAYMDLARR